MGEDQARKSCTRDGARHAFYKHTKCERKRISIDASFSCKAATLRCPWAKTEREFTKTKNKGPLAR